MLTNGVRAAPQTGVPLGEGPFNGAQHGGAQHGGAQHGGAPSGGAQHGETEGAVQLAAELLMHAARRLYRCAAAELGPVGLTGAQARVVRHLERAAKPVRMADIAAALDVVPRTATSMVDGLETAGLVERSVDPNDRRSLLVSLTDKGRERLDALAQARRRTAEAAFQSLSPDELDELARLLGALCCGCKAHASPEPGPTRAEHGSGSLEGANEKER